MVLRWFLAHFCGNPEPSSGRRISEALRRHNLFPHEVPWKVLVSGVYHRWCCRPTSELDLIPSVLLILCRVRRQSSGTTDWS